MDQGSLPLSALRSQALIDRQVAQLSRLVDDLLDVSRITRGKINLNKEVIELGTLITRTVETVQPLIDERGHTLTVDVPKGMLAVLGALSSFGPLSMDMYLPSTPTIAANLHASQTLVQLTLSGCLAGLAVGQLVPVR